MSKRIIYSITSGTYDTLTTREKLNRVSKLVRTLHDIDSDLFSKQAIEKKKTVLKRYLLNEDIQYMTDQEKALFRHYNLIDSNNKVIENMI